MNHSRLRYLFVLMFVAAMALSGCGSGEELDTTTAEEPAAAEAPAESTAAETEEEEPAAEEETADESQLSLTIWADEVRAGVLEGLAADFESEYGVALVVEQMGFGDIRSQMSIAAPAGEGPDVLIGAHDWLGELVGNGTLAPIELDAVGDFAPAALQAFTYEGELYGLPYSTENVALFVNADIVPQCPATWSEVTNISRELAAENGDDINANRYGFVGLEGDPYHFFPIQTAFGGYVFGLNADGYDPNDVGIDSEGSLAAAEFWSSFVAEGLQPAGVDGDTMMAFFESGQSAMTITGPWNLPRIREAGVNYLICPTPGEVNATGQPFLGSQGFMVSAFSENPLAAQIFIKEYVGSPEVMQALFEADPRTPAYTPLLEQIDDKDLAGFGAAGVNALPMPAIPEMGSVWEAWGNAVTLIGQQGDDPINAFTNAAEQIRSAIEERQ